MSIHSVLNPSSISFRVLVEDIQVGQPEDGGDGDIADAGGFPVSNARVVIYGDAGDSAVGIEGEFGSNSRGVYWFRNESFLDSPGTHENGISIRGGVRYRLRVTASGRPAVRATTLVPDARLLGWEDCCREFNVDWDSLRLQWPAARGAKAYAVWISAPGETYRIFADGNRIALGGGRRTSMRDVEHHPFLPGMTQNLLVTALDTNYVDYYRSQTNPLTGTGLITRVEGGTGVFGSSAEILRLTVRTRSTQDEPIEGLFQRVDDDPAEAPEWIDLYKSPPDRNGDVRLSGWYGSDSTVNEGDIRSYTSRDNEAVYVEHRSSMSGFSGRSIAPDTIRGRVTGCGVVPSGDIIYVKRRVITGPRSPGLTSSQRLPGPVSAADLRKTPRDNVMLSSC